MTISKGILDKLLSDLGMDTTGCSSASRVREAMLSGFDKGSLFFNYRRH